MPVCQNCYQQWNWKQTLKKSFTLDTSLRCPYCEEKQYPSSKSKNRFAVYSFVPLLSLLLPVFFDISAVFVISILAGSGLLLVCLYPFIIELSNQEDTFQ